MALNFEEIAIAFRNCTGDSKFSFKEFIKNQYKSKEEYERGFIISNANNYILTDIEKLLSKSILNICATDYLIKQGYFSWGFVTSYYANFFLVQALNRTQLNFTTWVESSIDCLTKNYQKQTLEIKTISRSSDQHQREFQRFFENFRHFRNRKGIDRYWNIGLTPFDLGNESEIRNKINYELSSDGFYELDLEIQEFKKMINYSHDSPFDKPKEDSRMDNYARQNLRLAMSRLRILTYVLNVVAIRNSEYQSYYQRNMKNRLYNIQEKYPDLSEWIIILLEKWLFFNSELIEKDEI